MHEPMRIEIVPPRRIDPAADTDANSARALCDRLSGVDQGLLLRAGIRPHYSVATHGS
jgi:hypothetical protein